MKRVSESGQRKIERALAAGYDPARCLFGPTAFLRQLRGRGRAKKARGVR